MSPTLTVLLVFLAFLAALLLASTASLVYFDAERIVPGTEAPLVSYLNGRLQRLAGFTNDRGQVKAVYQPIVARWSGKGARGWELMINPRVSLMLLVVAHWPFFKLMRFDPSIPDDEART